MKYSRPPYTLAGFAVEQPESAVPELLYAGEQWATTNFVTPQHTHDGWEFYLQISGETIWDVLGQSYKLVPGSFLVVAPNAYHNAWGCSKNRPHFFVAMIDLTCIWARHAVLKDIWQVKTAMVVPHGESLFVPFSQVIREISVSLLYRSAGLRLALDALVVEASRLLQQDSDEPALMGIHPMILRAQELLFNQPNRQWRLADLAQLLGLSPGYLAECFTREMGISPHQYLLQVRVDRAKETLRRHDVRITDLALELGFCSSQHFASTFKRLTGTTAQQYRSQFRTTTAPELNTG